MSIEETLKESGELPDYSGGANSREELEVENQPFDEDGKISVEQDPVSEWKKNAGGMYKGTKSAINELCTNAITAVIRAKRIFDLDDLNIEVTIREDSENEVYLIIRDEGIGMTKDTLNTLGRIGEGKGHVGEDVNSRHGRGFYSGYMLVGDGKNDGKGAFPLSTNPRTNDENGNPPYNLICKPLEFSFTDKHKFSLDEDEYGTKIVFPVRDGISADELEEWVREFAVMSREPIILNRTYPDGSSKTDELGNVQLEDRIEEPYITIEKENCYRAVVSPNAEGTLGILDATINLDDEYTLKNITPLNLNVDVRFLNEDGPVYESENEDHIGKTPVLESQYEDAPAEVRDMLMLKDDLTPSDKTLQEPTGTRDIISLDDEFVEHLEDEIVEKFENNVPEIMNDVQSVEDFELMVENSEFSYIKILANRPQHILRKFFSLSDLGMGSDKKNLIKRIGNSIKEVNRNATINNRVRIGSGNYERKYIYDIIGEDFYYGKSILQRRADAVWEDSEDNIVIQSSNDHFSILDKLGGTKIYNITSSTVKNYDVSDETIQKFKSARSTTKKNNTSSNSERSRVAEDYENREYKIHYRTYATTKTVKVKDIKERFVDNVDNKVPDLAYIVVFTSVSDHKISENQQLVNNNVGTMTCVEKVFQEELSDIDNVVKYEDIKDISFDMELLTEDGMKNLQDIVIQGSKVCVLNKKYEKAYQKLKQDDMFRKRYSDNYNVHIYMKEREKDIIESLYAEQIKLDKNITKNINHLNRISTPKVLKLAKSYTNLDEIPRPVKRAIRDDLSVRDKSWWQIMDSIRENGIDQQIQVKSEMLKSPSEQYIDTNKGRLSFDEIDSLNIVVKMPFISDLIGYDVTIEDCIEVSDYLNEDDTIALLNAEEAKSVQNLLKRYRKYGDLDFKYAFFKINDNSYSYNQFSYRVDDIWLSNIYAKKLSEENPDVTIDFEYKESKLNRSKLILDHYVNNNQ